VSEGLFTSTEYVDSKFRTARTNFKTSEVLKEVETAEQSSLANEQQ
jgi:hypothetical protein